MISSLWSRDGLQLKERRTYCRTTAPPSNPMHTTRRRRP